MNCWAKFRVALLAALFALSSDLALATNLTSDQVYQINHMNPVASKLQLGNVINTLSLGSPALTATHLFVGNGSNVATDVALSGDGTLSNAGALTISNNAITYPKLDSSVAVLSSSITVSQADLTGINTTPKQLIAAPGAGKLLMVDEVEVLHTYSTAAYTTCGKVQIQYHGSTDIVDLAASVITGASSKTYFAKPSFTEVDNSTGSTPVDLGGKANLAVDFTAATADCAAGNAANILKVRLKYRVITLQT